MNFFYFFSIEASFFRRAQLNFFTICTLFFSSTLPAFSQYSAWMEAYKKSPSDSRIEAETFERTMLFFYNRSLDSLLLTNKMFTEVAGNKKLPEAVRTLASAHANFFQSMYLMGKNENAQAQPFAQKAVNGYESVKAYNYAFSGYNVLANLFRASKNEAMTYKYFKQALNAAEMINDSVRIAKAWNNLAMSFVERDQLGLKFGDSAKFYYTKALNYTLRNGSTVSKIQLLGNVSNFYTASKDFRTATRYSEMAIALLDSNSTLEARVASYLTLAQIYAKDKKPLEALRIIEKILPQLERDSLLINFLTSAYTVQIRAYKALNLPDSAYAAYEAFVFATKKMISLSTRKEFNELAVKYELTKKEQENLQLKTETQAQRIVIYIVLLIVSLLSFLIYLIWYRAKNKAIIANKQLALEEERRIAIENELQLAGQIVVNKNKTLLHLRGLIEENNVSASSHVRADIARLIETIEKDIKTDGANDTMLSQTQHIEASLEFKLKEKFPHLTKNDIRLCAYIQLGFSSAEIASFLNITENSLMVRRSRLRAKLGLVEGEKFKEFLDKL